MALELADSELESATSNADPHADPPKISVWVRALSVPATSGNKFFEISWSEMGAPYHCLLQSAGATEGLFATRELHQEPPPLPLRGTFREATSVI